MSSPLTQALIGGPLRRPVTVMMGFIALLVVGGIAYMRIPLQLFPSGFEPGRLSIQIAVPESTPSEVEQRVTRPLERALGTIPGVKSMTSSSAASGAWLNLTFDDSVPADDAYQQVWDRLDRVSADFPETARDPRVRRFNPDDFPIAFVGVSLEEGGDPARLRDDMLFSRIESELMRAPGVARVLILGRVDTTVDIDLRQGQVDGLGVNLYELVQRLQRANFTLGAGDVVEGQRKLLVRSQARFDNVAELLNYPVRPGLPLHSLGEVGKALALENSMVRINGKRSILLLINKKSEANTLDATDAIRHAIENVLPGDPRLSDIRFHLLWDQGKEIRASLDNLRTTILQGACVAILVLLWFLRHLRMTVIVMLAIPISLLAAITAMYFCGETLNLISLMGITLGVGMLVDNSVVVVEAIKGQVEEGLGAYQAALVGASRVALAVIVATSTTIVVFLPLMLAGDAGTMRFFLIRLGLPVCLSLSASLVVAMILIPPASRLLLASEGKPSGPPGPLRRGLGWLGAGVAATVDGPARWYRGLLGLAIRYRLETVVVAGALFYAAYACTEVEQTDMNEGQQRRLSIRVQMPSAYTLRKASEVFEKIEAVLAKRQQALDIKTYFSDFESTNGRVRVFLSELNDMKLDRDAVVAKLKPLMPSIPGVRIKVGAEEDTRSKRTAMPVTLEGPDSEVLADLARRVAERLETVDGVREVDDPFEQGTPEVLLRIDRELAERYGVDPQVAVGMISYTFSGRTLPRVRFGGQELWLRIRVARSEDPRVDEVAALLIPTNKNTRVPLGTVARFERRRAAEVIHRQDHKTVLTLTCHMAKRQGEGFATQSARVKNALAGMRFPAGYRVRPSDRSRELGEQQSTFAEGALVAVCLVFLLMGVLFESWLLPLAILFSIPFAFAGVWVMLWLTSTPQDAMVLLGLIVLIGVVINNGVVLIDRVHQLRAAGSRDAAILDGCSERFRPILMTALTTIGGLIPMAMGASASTGIPYDPLGRAVIGGLAASTMLTLFVVPVMYALLDDLGEFGGSLLAWWGGR